MCLCPTPRLVVQEISLDVFMSHPQVSCTIKPEKKKTNYVGCKSLQIHAIGKSRNLEGWILIRVCVAYYSIIIMTEVTIALARSPGESKTCVGPVETICKKPVGPVKTLRSKLIHSIFYLRNLYCYLLLHCSIWKPDNWAIFHMFSLAR